MRAGMDTLESQTVARHRRSQIPKANTLTMMPGRKASKPCCRNAQRLDVRPNP
jgi:hypothetical protein